jgi:hypothetical protein
MIAVEVAENAQELARIILKYTSQDSGCDWVVVGLCVYIRDTQRKVVAQIRRTENVG